MAWLEKELLVAKERERKEVLKKVRELCQKSWFTVSMLKDCLVEGRKAKAK